MALPCSNIYTYWSYPPLSLLMVKPNRSNSQWGKVRKGHAENIWKFLPFLHSHIFFLKLLGAKGYSSTCSWTHKPFISSSPGFFYKSERQNHLHCPYQVRLPSPPCLFFKSDGARGTSVFLKGFSHLKSCLHCYFISLWSAYYLALHYIVHKMDKAKRLRY